MGLFRKKYLIEHPEKYEEKEREVIVLAENTALGSRWCDNKYYSVNVRLIGCVDCKTGELLDMPRYITWNYRPGGKMNVHGIKRHGIYRLKVRFSLPCETDFGKIPTGRSMFVAKVLKRKCSEPRLKKLLEEYKKPVAVETSSGEKLTLVRENNNFSGIIKWCDDDINVSLSVDSGCDTCEKAMKTFNAIMTAKEEWDKKAKLYLAKENTENANDWQSGEENYTPITEADFAKRITLCWINISENGDFEFWYDDDGMFFSHTLVAYGTLEEGFTEYNMMG